MSGFNALTPSELRATTGLAGIYAVRMAGLFMILPVLALYGDQLLYATPLLMGIALGIYGLTQALLQIPFGMLSDRLGRKPLIAFGLFLLILGSLIAAQADTIYGIILGRALQGAGAVAAVVLALTADLIAEERRTRALAVIGLTIGLTFTGAMVLGPIVDRWMGLAGIFWLTAGLGVVAILLLFFWVPQPQRVLPHPDMVPRPGGLRRVLAHPGLMRLNAGIFFLHLILSANFLVIPLLLVQELGLASEQHYRVYLPVLLISFMLMLPFIILAERRRILKPALLVAIGLLSLVQLALPFATHWLGYALALIGFFAAFNWLEASLPSLIAKSAPVAEKGTAMGVFATCQFFGIFVGGALGGLVWAWLGAQGVFGLGFLAAATWFVLAITMAQPPYVSYRTYGLPAFWQSSPQALQARLAAVPGVVEARVSAVEQALYLRVDTQMLDAQALRCLLEQGEGQGQGQGIVSHGDTEDTEKGKGKV